MIYFILKMAGKRMVHVMERWPVAIILVATFVLGQSIFAAHGPDHENENALSLCHATGNGGYIVINIATDGGNGNGNNDHTLHPNDIIPMEDLNADQVIDEVDCQLATQDNPDEDPSDETGDDETGDDPEPDPTGSITVCKILTDQTDQPTDGVAVTGDTFNINGLEAPTGYLAVGVLPSSVFTAPLLLNTDLIGNDGVMDAQCITHGDLELGGYFYDEEQINGSGSYLEPMYNDENSIPVATIDDVFSYTDQLFTLDLDDDAARDQNADGHIVLSAGRPDRRLVVRNTLERNLECYLPTLLTNPDFEMTDTRVGLVHGNLLSALGSSSPTWDIYDSLPSGWFTQAGSGIEVQYSGTVVTPHSGSLMLELDSHSNTTNGNSTNSTMSQIVTLQGGDYDLSFWYRARTSTVNDSRVNVLLDGVIVDTFDSVDTSVWNEQVVRLEDVSAGAHTVSLQGDGIENSLGALIDDANLLCATEQSEDPGDEDPVPDPVPTPVTLCHVPAGNPENAQTIVVNSEQEADEQHLSIHEDDYTGECEPADDEEDPGDEDPDEDPGEDPAQSGTGSITICKLLTDSNGTVMDGSLISGNVFSIEGVAQPEGYATTSALLPVTGFTTPLSLNRDLLGSDGIMDAQCVTYDNLAYGDYYYSEEQMPSDVSLFNAPTYNDQNTVSVQTLLDFYAYSNELFTPGFGDDLDRNVNADGHIAVSLWRPEWTLVVKNVYIPASTDDPGDDTEESDEEDNTDDTADDTPSDDDGQGGGGNTTAGGGGNGGNGGSNTQENDNDGQGGGGGNGGGSGANGGPTGRQLVVVEPVSPPQEVLGEKITAEGSGSDADGIGGGQVLGFSTLPETGIPMGLPIGSAIGVFGVTYIISRQRRGKI